MSLVAKNIVFTVFVPGTVAVLVPFVFVRHGLPEPAGTAVIGSVVLLVGAAVYAWCVRDFAIHGRGTPVPVDAPKELVTRGLYRHVRNPMYLGVLLVIAGWALLFRSVAILLYGLGVGTAFHSMVVFYEEPHLKKEFGPAYERYCSRVGRWVPTWRRERAA